MSNIVLNILCSLIISSFLFSSVSSQEIPQTTLSPNLTTLTPEDTTLFDATTQLPLKTTTLPSKVTPSSHDVPQNDSSASNTTTALPTTTEETSTTSNSTIEPTPSSSYDCPFQAGTFMGGVVLGAVLGCIGFALVNFLGPKTASFSQN